MGRKSNLDKEERVQVVMALLRGEEKLEVLARRHGICANTLDGPPQSRLLQSISAKVW